MNNYEKAIEAAEKLGSEMPIEILHSNIALVLNYLTQFDRALYFLNKAEQPARDKANYQLLASILINKGLAYGNKSEFEESTKNFDEALTIAKKYNYPEITITGRVNMGNIALKQNRPKNALSHFNAALAVKGK